MSKNWALVVGINSYNPSQFSPLKYAKRDAELVRDFFCNEVNFDEVVFFADDSPPHVVNGNEIPTYPSYGNLESFLYDRFEKPFLSTGDNCWFFFAGHGEQYEGADYLIPIDGSVRSRRLGSLLPLSFVRQQLQRSGADNVILITDACRSQGARGKAGAGFEVQQGVITISACSPTQKSWEEETELKQGIFTYALLEALRLPGPRSCATVERLDNYLKQRVPELCQQYGKFPEQAPRIKHDPSERRHFILLPNHVWEQDIEMLKTDVLRLMVKEDWSFAEQICYRAIVAASGRDRELLDFYSKIRSHLQSTSQEAYSSSTVSRTSQSENLSFSESYILKQESRILPVSYSLLENLLQKKIWRDADRETCRIIVRLAGKDLDEPLLRNDLEKISLEEIFTIDRLWMRHSNGRFGFCLQANVWEKCGKPGTSGDEWSKFCVGVGWKKRRSDNYLLYDELEVSQLSTKCSLPCYLWVRQYGPNNHGLMFGSDSMGWHPWVSGTCGAFHILARRIISANESRDIDTNENHETQNYFFHDFPEANEAKHSLDKITDTQHNNIGDLESRNSRNKPPIKHDYSNLEYLLKNRQWREADRETLKIMLKICKREKEGWLDISNLKRFPCASLRVIDQLWVKHSNGKFGLSVQKEIWAECNRPTIQNADWENFSCRIGWREKGDWWGQGGDDLRYEQLALSSKGELPWALWFWGGCDEGFDVVYSRIEACLYS